LNAEGLNAEGLNAEGLNAEGLNAEGLNAAVVRALAAPQGTFGTSQTSALAGAAGQGAGAHVAGNIPVGFPGAPSGIASGERSGHGGATGFMRGSTSRTLRASFSGVRSGSDRPHRPETRQQHQGELDVLADQA
jgi:hypothetical protein